MTQKFIYMGVPKAQGRPKFYRRGNFVGAYDPKDSREYKNNIAAQIVAQNPVLIGQGVPIELQLTFWLPRPKSHYGKNGVKERYLSARHISKPDKDNLEKAVMDALKGIVWHDDSQVFRTISAKYYTSGEPRVVIHVTDESSIKDGY